MHLHQSPFVAFHLLFCCLLDIDGVALFANSTAAVSRSAFDTVLMSKLIS